ncbi:hypothetical protein LTR85_006120 [Meristemomyces frigidus]|nr:hypothetical protein LTR85_006120 [Meristemomyces frigidus]
MKRNAICVALAATLSSLATAQETASQTSSSSPTSTDGEITIHTITVGEVENQFSPDNITATPGDIVTFVFYPSNHSVIQSVYGYPCIPSEDVTDQQGFFSGFQPIANTSGPLPSWNLTINTTDPVWYYCGAPGSCIGYSMLGVINANVSGSLEAQKRLAGEANYMLEPGQAVPNAALTSLQALAATVTATVTASATASPTSSTSAASAATPSAAAATQHHSVLSTGAIVGIAIGGAAVAILAAAVFFLLGRTKTLKERLHYHHTSVAPPPMQEAAGYGFAQNRHQSSQLPPYQPAYHVAGQQENKPPTLAQTSARSMSQGSPETVHDARFQYTGLAPQPRPADYR